MGKKKQPFYRIVAADSRAPRDGRFLETLGQYNPITKPAKVTVQEDRIDYWLDRGAQPSDTVKALFTQIGLTEKRTMAKAGKDVSEMALKTEINERKKRTRGIKKAVLKAEEEKQAATETPAEETASEETAE